MTAASGRSACLGKSRVSLRRLERALRVIKTPKPLPLASGGSWAFRCNNKRLGGTSTRHLGNGVDSSKGRVFSHFRQPTLKSARHVVSELATAPFRSEEHTSELQSP